MRQGGGERKPVKKGCRKGHVGLHSFRPLGDIGEISGFFSLWLRKPGYLSVGCSHPWWMEAPGDFTPWCTLHVPTAPCQRTSSDRDHVVGVGSQTQRSSPRCTLGVTEGKWAGHRLRLRGGGGEGVKPDGDTIKTQIAEMEVRASLSLLSSTHHSPRADSGPLESPRR